LQDHAQLVAQMARSLRYIDRWIDKAHAHATARKFDPAVLLQSRLAPDMFPLIRQIGAACDTAKFTAARLSGKTPPSHPDKETSWDEIRGRLREVIAYVEGFGASSFEGASERRMTFGWMPGKQIAADDYLVQYAVPNFYFHVAMTYAILRHNGVEIGKADYLGDLPFMDL